MRISLINITKTNKTFRLKNGAGIIKLCQFEDSEIIDLITLQDKMFSKFTKRFPNNKK